MCIPRMPGPPVIGPSGGIGARASPGPPRGAGGVWAWTTVTAARPADSATTTAAMPGAKREGIVFMAFPMRER